MNNILETIGNTPMVKVKENIYAKVEYFNPTGSIKDRAAYYMVKDLIPKINKETVLIEPTSGNTGIGLALVCKQLGYKLIIVMPENMSMERRLMISAYGAEIVLTDKALGMQGAIDKAFEINKEISNSAVLSQFTNKSNCKAHIETTAPEIFKDNPNIKWIVSPVGSGGTIMGIKQYIVENNIDCKVCAVEPENSAVLSGGEKGSHNIQGIGAGFVTDLTDLSLIDKIIKVSDEEAVEYANKLVNESGIMGGYSTGASYCATMKLSKEVEGDILFIVPDNGFRYLSTDLYRK